MRYLDVPVERVVVPEYLLRGADGEVDTSDLEDSIRELGVLQPILLEERGGKLYLVAGYRRLHAAKRLGLPSVPAVIASFNGDEKALLAELAENGARRELPPHREAEAVLNLLAYRLGVSTEEAAHLVYRLDNAQSGKGTPPPPEVAGVITSTLSVLGRSLSHFARKILPTLRWPEEVKEAVERGEISTNLARRLAKRPSAAGEVIKRLREGENPKGALKAAIEEVREIAQAASIQKTVDALENWPLLEGNILKGRKPLETAPELLEVAPMRELVADIIRRKEWYGRVVALLWPEPEAVMGALDAGAHVLWVDSTPHAHYVHRWGEVELPHEVIAFYRPGENRAEKWGDPNPDDPTALGPMPLLALLSRYPVVAAPLREVHRFGRPIVGVSTPPGVWAFAFKYGAEG
ncbi:hypothetical protein MN1_300 [Thermus phage MN1]|nr:hypothetical protein MN1_300 [Thermus phage MN1]